MQSGIAPLDVQLGELQPGRLYLLTGSTGTGKTTSCLQFLRDGLRRLEPGVLITLDRTSDLVSHARSIDLDLEASLRASQLLILRFSGPFTSLIESAGLPDPVIDELSRAIADVEPLRVAIDPVTPFLAERCASASALDALANLLEGRELTSLLTYPHDVSAEYDARVSPLVQRAAAIAHLTRDVGGVHAMRIVQARWRATPSEGVRFRVCPGVGMVALDEQPARVPESVSSKPPRARVRKREAAT